MTEDEAEDIVNAVLSIPRVFVRRNKMVEKPYEICIDHDDDEIEVVDRDISSQVAEALADDVEHSLRIKAVLKLVNKGDKSG